MPSATAVFAIPSPLGRTDSRSGARSRIRRPNSWRTLIGGRLATEGSTARVARLHPSVCTRSHSGNVLAASSSLWSRASSDDASQQKCLPVSDGSVVNARAQIPFPFSYRHGHQHTYMSYRNPLWRICFVIYARGVASRIGWAMSSSRMRSWQCISRALCVTLRSVLSRVYEWAGITEWIPRSC